MSCSELFSFFRGLRILLKTQGSLWDPDKSIYNTCTSDPPQTWSKCHITHLKCCAVLRVQARHVWANQWSFQSSTANPALLFPCCSDERWKRRLDYSIVEHTPLVHRPSVTDMVTSSCGWSHTRRSYSSYLVMTIKRALWRLKMIIPLLLSSKCNIKLKDFPHWSVLRTANHSYL